LAILQPFIWLLCFVVLAIVINYLRKPAVHLEFAASDESSKGVAGDLFESAPIGYLEIDRQGMVRRANRQQCSLLGLGTRDVIGKHCADFVPSLERERYREQISRKIAGQQALLPYQREWIRPDGSKVIVEVHEQLLRDASGHPAGIRMAAVDVTERKTSEDQAYQIATELRALFQAFPDLFLRVDRNGKVLDAKGGQRSDPFLTPEKFIARKLHDILPGEVVSQLGEAQDNVRKTNAMEIIEFTVDGRSGQEAYETRVLPLDWEQWIAILRNITSRKTDERTLKEYAQELERKNDELESALVTAREATQLKSRFLANMSHEIRTPMNGVLGMTDFLLGTHLTAEQQEYAESIKRSADSLLTLINDILDLSRIEAGKLRLDRVPFLLKTILEETISLFALQARAKSLDFVSEISPTLPDVAVGDPERLRQVLTNLLGNAIKFTDSGRVGLTAELVTESMDRIQIRFTVHDTGIGIATDYQSRLFESFTQGDGSSTRKYGGTGLGLAISKQLVEMLDGEIGMESALGHGSQFWFTAFFGKPAEGETVVSPAPVARPQKAPIKIPVAPIARPVSGPAQTAPVAELKPGRHANRRVLLAEDNEINQRITLRLLQKLGLAADAVVNGREAVDAMEKREYDLVLMDCMMPQMDGFEATAIIRNREGNSRRTPICALTANAMEGDREKCLGSGMDDYISKPVSLEKLQEAVHRWMGEPADGAIEPNSAAGARN
jgi:PAS domain S-box-containing protein